MGFFGGKKRAKTPAAQLKKVNSQIAKQKIKQELKQKRAQLANMRLKG